MLATEIEEQWDPYKALYIHVPFCKQRCYYCDFVTQACRTDDPILDEYLERLISTIRLYSNADLLGEIETVYIGGGTPTYLGNSRLASLLYALSISMHLTPEVECSLEANPDSLTLAMVKDLYALGVTRLSLGVQTFNDSLLKTLGRVHSSDQAKQAIAYAQERFENISIDLMCGLPGQTPEQFQYDLETALSLGVKHISVYPLTVEEGTPLDAMIESNLLQVDEDSGADFMDQASDYLSKQGMHRYEVASYAFPGYESRHNSAYWLGKPYLGLGHGAVSMRQNSFSRQRFSEDEGIIETLDPFQRAAEDIMLKMRMSQGVSDDEVAWTCILLPEIDKVLDSLEEEHYLVHEGNRWRPTHKGWLFGNHLYGEILDLAP